jgi:phosphatidylserine/phosphatidylglycerophosphate/cardiolipin synthase-like enzyme
MRKTAFPSAAIAAFLLLIIAFSPSAGANVWWDIYFTDPARNGDHGTYSPPEDAFIALIGSAQKSIDGAFFEIGSVRVADAFIKAQKRGVNVRLVTDDSNKEKAGCRKVKASGIPVVDDGKKGLMHNKFAIIDGHIVWTGSYNITDSCAYRNNNNALKIDSAELSSLYESEFTEMFENHIFENRKGMRSLPSLSNPYYVQMGDTNISAYFSPENNVEDIIVHRIKKAKSSIYFLAFSFTSDPIGEAMIERSKHGVKVAGVFERNGSDAKDSEYRKMLVENIPVVQDRNRNNMHHKVIIIDEEIVITGSYNFSKNAANRNDENLIILENREISKLYLSEFHKIYSIQP